jgi:hypothetical protein
MATTGNGKSNDNNESKNKSNSKNWRETVYIPTLGA